MDTRTATAAGTEKRKDELGWTLEQQPVARDWGADGSAKADELAPGLAEDAANKRGCKSAAQVWMSLLSLCDRMCGSAAWLVLFTCLHGVRSLRVPAFGYLPRTMRTASLLRSRRHGAATWRVGRGPRLCAFCMGHLDEGSGVWDGC